MMGRVTASDQPTATAYAVRLEVTSGTSRVEVPAGQPILMGRDKSCQLVVDHPSVSRRHAEIVWMNGGWVMRDLKSRNGIFLNGTRAALVIVADGEEVRLGDAEQGPVVRFALHGGGPDPEPAPTVAPLAAAVAGRTPAAAHDATGRVRIGRSPDNDVVLADLRASRHHAELRRVADGYEVVDLGSRNGTYVDGSPVRRATLRPGDVVAIGRHQLTFDGQRLVEFVDTGPVSLAADELSVQVGKQVLLDGVSFALEEGSLLAVIGPSGCGKSTLVRALTGIRPATRGRVRYDGRDLYTNYAELRYRIGMVPQDDVLHRQLTVRRALRFSAALRFADDVPRRERNARVDEVLETLGLTQRAKQRIDTLSGGQRKRTSVALELLTEPSLLCLDEPTSGLDPALDKEVMQELRELADSGRTVVVVTHNVLNIDMCDRVLVMCLGGTLGYFGPPDELLEFFGAKDYAEVFAGVTDDPQRWTRAFRDSEQYRRYVAPELERAAAAAPPGMPLAADPTGRVIGRATVGKAPAVRAPLGRVPLRTRVIHPAAPLRQWLTLCMRMFAVIGSDRGYSLFLLGLPLALALLTHTVPGKDGLGPPSSNFSLEAQRVLVVLVVGAAFLGTAVAIREIVSEATIYKRERAVGLSAGAYLGSKLAVFTVVTAVQVVLFVWLALLGRPGPRSALVVGSAIGEIMVAVALTAIASAVFGLVVSALARTPEQTTPVLVVAVMTQLVLCGGLFELHGEAALDAVSWLSPSRWGLAAGASTVDLLKFVPFNEPLWTHTVGAWWRSALLLVVQAAVLAAAARLALRRLEPGRG
jgi:ABC-type multidrug transport system ATPase subunit/pSer/pThr/pTyr-binding forkhead associated (FHA) protein